MAAPPMRIPVTVLLDDLRQVATVNGIQMSYEFLAMITESTPPGLWFRFIRADDKMIVEQRKE